METHYASVSPMANPTCSQQPPVPNGNGLDGTMQQWELKYPPTVHKKSDTDGHLMHGFSAWNWFIAGKPRARKILFPIPPLPIIPTYAGKKVPECVCSGPLVSTWLEQKKTLALSLLHNPPGSTFAFANC